MKNKYDLYDEASEWAIHDEREELGKLEGKECRYYVAYGSNLNIRQMLDERCPGAEVVGTAVIKDYELLFKGSKTGSYLTIEKKKGKEVPVAIWEVNAWHEENLDMYEGYPIFYYKKEMVLPVKLKDSEEVKELNCFVYIMDEKRQYGVPTYRYLTTCIEGYESFGFDPEYILEAVSVSGDRAKADKKIVKYEF